jgi:hypothetical protein
MLNDVTVLTESEWAKRLNMRWSIPTMPASTETGYLPSSQNLEAALFGSLRLTGGIRKAL